MILIVTNSLTGGGAERAMNTLANALFAEGENVKLVAINRSNADLVKLECEYFCLGREHLSDFRETLNTFRHFYNLVIKLNPDNIILNCDLPEAFGALLPLRFKLTLVEHSPKPFGTRLLLGLLIRLILMARRVDCIRVSSHFKIWCMPRKNSKEIPNAVSLLKLNPRNDSKPSSINRLVFMGRLANPQKNPDICLEIAKQINLPIVFFGQGPEKIRLQKSSRVMGVMAEFKGHITNPWASIKKTDILIIPSRFEGDGLVLVEAILQDIKFLVSDIPDFRRFNLPSSFYCRNVDEFASRIRQLQVGELLLNISEVQKTRIIASRDPSRVAKAWINHFSST